MQRRTTVNTLALHVTAEKSACSCEMFLIFNISTRCCLFVASHKTSRKVEMQDDKIQDGFQRFFSILSRPVSYNNPPSLLLRSS